MIRCDPLLDELPDGVVLSDAVGTVLYMNPAAKRMLEVPARLDATLVSCDLLCGKLFAEDSDDPCRGRCALLQPGHRERAVAFAGRHGPQAHAPIVWNGEKLRRLERWGQYRVRCMELDGTLWGLPAEKRHFTIIEDVSAESELRRRKEEWRRMAVHDLRSPLTSVLGALRIVQDVPAGKPLDEQERGLVDAAVKACARMKDLLGAFLELSQLDEGSMPVRLEAVGAADVLRKAAEEIAPRARANATDVSVSAGAGLAVRADRALLERVVHNLLDNAIKFSPRGRAVTLAARAEDGGKLAAISVRDEGEGIPPEELPLVFDRFARTSMTRKPGSGSGLGLAFCRQAVKAMGGEISASSEPGRGTEFTVRLPAEEAPR